SAICEHNRLQLSAKNLFRDPCCFIDVAAPNPKISINHRRVVENEELLARWCSVLLDNFDLFLDQLGSQFPRILNLCGTADELRIGTVEPRNALEPSEDIC